MALGLHGRGSTSVDQISLLRLCPNELEHAKRGNVSSFAMRTNPSSVTTHTLRGVGGTDNARSLRVSNCCDIIVATFQKTTIPFRKSRDRRRPNVNGGRVGECRPRTGWRRAG